MVVCLNIIQSFQSVFYMYRIIKQKQGLRNQPCKEADRRRVQRHSMHVIDPDR